MTSQQKHTDLKDDLESTKTVDVEVIDLGNAKVETKQWSAWPSSWDSIYGIGRPG